MIYDGVAVVYAQDIYFRNLICYSLNVFVVLNIIRVSGLSSCSRDAARPLCYFAALFSAIFVFRCLWLACEFLFRNMEKYVH